MKPAWRYASGGIIWRIAPALTNLLVGETRDVQKKQVSFFCIQQQTGNVLWEGRSFGEQWWIDVEALHNDTLLLHLYATPDMPEHRSVIAVDVASGVELWRSTDVKFEAVAGERLLVSRRTSTGTETTCLALRSGKQEQADNFSVDYQNPVTESEIFPVQVFNVFSVGSPVNMLIRPHCDADTLVGPVEYSESENVVVFVHHERGTHGGQETLNAKLTVLDRGNGTLLFTETIHENSTVIVPENFFIEQGTLFYLHERTTICALPLSVRGQGA